MQAAFYSAYQNPLIWYFLNRWNWLAERLMCNWHCIEITFILLEYLQVSFFHSNQKMGLIRPFFDHFGSTYETDVTYHKSADRYRK